MASPKTPHNNEPSIIDHEYALREMASGFAQLTKVVEKMDAKLDKIEERISKLERSDVSWNAKWGVIVGIGGVLLGILIKFLPLHP